MAGIAPINSNQELLTLAQVQRNLATSFDQLSTGKRITSAAIDPSGLAIATALQVQAASLDAASTNVQTASNATNVASSAVQGISGIVSQLRDLAVQGVNDFLSPSDRAALQVQANQLVAQANTIAATTNFNGVNLLTGQFAGPQAGTPAAASVTANGFLAGNGTVVSSVTAANANFQNATGPAQGFGGTGTQDSTIQIQIVNNNGTAAAVATVTDSATGATVTSAPVAAGGTISGFENVNVNLGNFTLADVGQTSTVQIAQNVPANTQNNALNVQFGASEGNVLGVAIPGVNSSQLRISNIDLSSSASATNAIGQLDNAALSLGDAQSQLGAQLVSLQNQVNANDIQSLNEKNAQSSIADADIPSTVSKSTLAQLQQSANVALIAHNNLFAQSVLTLFK